MTTILKSLKGRYQFRLSAPSFIYPADYISNVKGLAPFLDEIELLFFESQADSLPTGALVGELNRLARDMLISYNVHLPLDIPLAAPTAGARQAAVDLLKMVLERVAPLSASTHTLHLNYNETDRRTATVRSWQDRLRSSLDLLLRDTSIAPGKISIETLNYPPYFFAPLVEQFGVSVCLDIGHILYHGFDLKEAVQRYRSATTIIHLHGTTQDRDHLSVAELPGTAQETVTDLLKGFTGSLSLEVFSLERLVGSMETLEKMMRATDA
jgi:sugar phosphate isomerase/epimerase